ncbi:helix-turn-helix domain containing protein, partial [Mycobacteroides abscessus subsp. massiliense]
MSNSGQLDSGGDQAAVPNGTPDDEQKTVGLDGKEYRKPKPRKKPEPKPKPETVAEPESVSTRKVQIPTAFRAEADAVQQHARALHDLTTDP